MTTQQQLLCQGRLLKMALVGMYYDDPPEQELFDSIRFGLMRLGNLLIVVTREELLLKDFYELKQEVLSLLKEGQGDETRKETILDLFETFLGKVKGEEEGVEQQTP